VGGAERLRGVHGQGSVNGDGYRVFHDKEHPLATAQGKVLEHRAVLYERIGEGGHPCHWCKAIVTWGEASAASRLNVDHLDGDKLNNDPANLVPSCMDCNTKRGAA